jgi:transglutaminase-like putative cysteine protease
LCTSLAVHASSDGEEVSIEQIADAIKKHIAEETQTGKGYYRLPHDGKGLQLKLVRVHMEYLADLGGGVQFACVDLADVSGDVYDVDFFLAGASGAMTVTERTVHKINGQPYYAWEQKRDGTWHRIEVEAASPRELGIINGKDKFTFRYRVTLPEITGPARMWLPLASTDPFQTVEVTSTEAPREQRVLKDREYGNRVLFLELGPEDGRETVEIRYRVERREKAVYPAGEADPQRYLRPERMVPANEEFTRIAEEVIKGKEGELVRARALYDHVIDNMRYMKYGNGWGMGNAVYACDARTGNCTDFHAYFIALARAVDIPARFAIGAGIPSERDEGGIDGYHCWAEFYADGKWWPVDISEGDKYTRLATYYFGHHPANRFELSRGRDLMVEPGPASGPINFLAYPVLEIEGEPVKVKVEFSFERKHS